MARSVSPRKMRPRASRLLAGVERAGEQGDAVGAFAGGRGGFAEELAGGEEVLGGEDLGGGHHGDLEAVFDGDEGGLEGDDGLAGADVALQEAAHGARFAHVGDDFAENALLGVGGLEGEHLLEGGADVFAGGEGGALALAELLAFEFEAEFEVPELFEDEAAVGGGAGFLELADGCVGGREVEVAEGLHAGGQLEAFDEGAGEGFLDSIWGGDAGFFEFAEEVPEDAAEPAGAEFGAPGGGAAEGGVDGDDAAHFEGGELGVVAGGRGRVGEDLEGGLDHLPLRCAGDAPGAVPLREPSSLP